ncbi:hypothetical protein BSKO_00049 [Bryopsis sp. KO-2023]|nr:hypothetical protein BSKO_00049 [Bryopsis sp. KO-2023]
MEGRNPFDLLGGFSTDGIDGGLVEEVKRRHGNSQAAVSKQIITVTGTVLEVLKDQNMQPTPTALFAAFVSTLEREQTLNNPEVVAAVCNVLSMAIGRLPDSMLQKKRIPMLSLLNGILGRHRGKPSPVKAALSCISPFLAVANCEPNPAASEAFETVLSFVWDSSPKVRKLVVKGLQQVLAGHRDTASEKETVAAIAKVSIQLLSKPEGAANEAANAPKKQRMEKEDEIRKAVVCSLHLMTCLAQILPLMQGEAVVEICAAVCRLFPLQQELLSLNACDVLKALFASPQQQLAAPVLAKLLKVLIDDVAASNMKVRELSAALCGVLDRGYCKLYKVDKMVCYQELPSAIHHLTQQLAAEHDGVRYAAVQALTSVLANCLDESMVSLAVQSQPDGNKEVSPLVSVVAAVGSCLGPRYQDAQAMALPVVRGLIEKLGREGAPLAEGLVEQLGVVYGALVEAEQEEEASDELRHYLSVGESAIGAAIKHIGPENVLQVLPLNILEGLDGKTEEYRTWLLPLFKKYVKSGSLAFWGSQMLPYARELGNRAAAADAAGQNQLASKCNALERQIWNSLPAFCSWCRDADTAFGECVRSIGGAFNRRSELRHVISQALVRLCSQSCTVLTSHGIRPDLCGYSIPPGLDNPDQNLEESMHTVPSHFTPELAVRTVETLRKHSAEWLQALYNAYISTGPDQRIPLFQAIAAYSRITDPTILAEFFKMILENLIKCMQGGDVVLPSSSDPIETQCTFIELASSIAAGLDDQGIGHLYKAALHTMEVKHVGIQKRAYKLMAYIVNHREEFLAQKLEELVEKMRAGLTTCMSPAKRFRIQCLAPIVRALGSKENPSEEEKEVVRIFVSEILICTNEKSKRAVDEAYKIIVELAEASIEGPEGFIGFLNIVMAGLLTQIPHTVAATVHGLSRLVHKYYGLMHGVSDQLLKTVLLLIRAKSREVDSAVLGFVNVCAMKYHTSSLLALLPEIMDALLVWRDDPKNKHRVKVKMIISRLASKCGFDEVERLIPANFQKQYTYIRKDSRRKDRRRREGTSEVDGEQDGMELDDEMAGSEWAHSKFFSNAGGMTSAGNTRMTGRSKAAPTSVKSGKSGRSRKSESNAFRFGRLVEGGDPMNMLDPSTSRSLAKAAAGMGGGGANRKEEEAPLQLPVNDEGKFLIDEKSLKKEERKENKRKASTMDDSDMDDDVKTHRSGATTKRSGASGISKGSTRSRKTTKSKVNSHHGGQRFKSKKGAGGDNQTGSKVEPFAYWKMDRNLLSRRRGKKASGIKDLDKVVNAVKRGANRAKKMRKD